MNYDIHITGLTSHINVQMINDYFSKYGPLTSIKMQRLVNPRSHGGVIVAIR